MLPDPTESPPELEFMSNTEVFATVKEHDPKTVGEALSSPEARKWRKAMDAEISQLLQRGTFKFVPAPNKRASLTAKWVFKEKRDSENQIFKYKARLVAKGFLQIQGIDYDKTFATTASATSAWIVLALATRYQ